MDYTQIQNWINTHTGEVAIFLVAFGYALSSIIGLIKRYFRKKREKPQLNISVIDTPTICSSFSADEKNIINDIHRTAFLVYLKIHNSGKVPVQIGDIHLGYTTEAEEFQDKLFWLQHEVVLLEDFTMPMGENLKVFPFLKQQNFYTQNRVNTYLQPDEEANGLVYFEQDDSVGKYYPYMEPDFKVQTTIVVHDNKKNKWSVDYRITKTKIEAIRKNCPSFGKIYSAVNR